MDGYTFGNGFVLGIGGYFWISGYELFFYFLMGVCK